MVSMLATMGGASKQVAEDDGGASKQVAEIDLERR